MEQTENVKNGIKKNKKCANLVQLIHLTSRLTHTNIYPIWLCSPFNALKTHICSYDPKVIPRSHEGHSQMMYGQKREKREFPIFQNWLDRRKKLL